MKCTINNNQASVHRIYSSGGHCIVGSTVLVIDYDGDIHRGDKIECDRGRNISPYIAETVSRIDNRWKVVARAATQEDYPSKPERVSAKEMERLTVRRAMRRL